jgi:hypothetical protein
LNLFNCRQLKHFFFGLAILVGANSAFSQDQDSSKAGLDLLVKTFTWDIEKVPRGTLMFLDVPYQRDNQDSLEYLTLTVAKDRSQDRPAFISLIIPNNVVQQDGVFLAFAKSVKTDQSPGWQIELEKADPLRIAFESCSAEKQTCTARIPGGYLTNEKTKEKIDVFQKFLDFDHAYFMVVYPDGSHKSIGVPLFSFKQQYKLL